MAKLYELGQDYLDWLAEKPDNIKDLIKKHPPNLLYEYGPTKVRVCIVSYLEDEKKESYALQVAVTGKYNLVAFDHCVYDVPPEALTECDLPPPEETIGSLLKEQKDIDQFIKAARDQTNVH